MRPIATDGVAWSVCLLSVGHVCEPCKTDEWIEMLFGSVTGGPKELYIRWGSDPPKRSGKFLGLSNPLINTVSHCSGVCCKKSTASARLLQPTALLPHGQRHMNFSPVKNPPPSLRRGLLSESFDHLLLLLETFC